MKRFIAFAKIIFLFFIYVRLQSLSVGSNTAGSRQPFINFPSIDANNTMLGFAVFESGFALQTATTTCTYDDLYPVSGTVNLRGGRLHLRKDLIFNNSLNITTSGSFFCANKSIEFGPFLQDFKLSTSLTFDTANIVLNMDTYLNGPLQFRNTCRIDGRGKVLNLQGNSSIVVRPGGNLTFENVELQGVKASNIRCLTDRGAITFRNSIINLANNYTFSRGLLLFDEDVVITGSTRFIYSTRLSSTINTDSILLIDRGVTFSYAPVTNSTSLIVMTDVTSNLYLNGCTLYTTRTGLSLSTGTIFLDDLVTFTSDAQFDAEALCLGANVNAIMLGNSQLRVFGRLKI